MRKKHVTAALAALFLDLGQSQGSKPMSVWSAAPTFLEEPLMGLMEVQFQL